MNDAKATGYNAVKGWNTTPPPPPAKENVGEIRGSALQRGGLRGKACVSAEGSRWRAVVKKDSVPL